MSSTDDNRQNNASESVAVIKDLESLLREHVDPRLRLLDFTSDNLLPDGENYSSIIVKIEASVRIGDDREENLSLVAKTVPQGGHKTQVKTVISFSKEIFIFESLMPAFKGLDPTIDVLPKFYGGRLTLDEESEHNDEDIVLLMENLKTKGYHTKDRKQGFDYAHAEFAIRELAKWHGLSIALRQKNDEFFARCRRELCRFPYELQVTSMSDLAEHIARDICADERMAPHKELISRELQANLRWNESIERPEEGPWAGITHGDFWVNNIMYLDDENGQPKDVKFVDFQMVSALSVLRDLPYFLCTSCSMEVLRNRVDELLDSYYETLVETLEGQRCDLADFTRASFDEQLRQDANPEFIHCLMSLKFFTLEVDDDLDLMDVKSTLFDKQSSSLYLDRSWEAVRAYFHKKWLLDC
ncbi:hypothetical protein TKK_0019534 [Trichogramma kaykai]|uniref:CHK kinase-like domain-containing protein n=1 Tax=Trichogramma kaykai TaxID=54128 RepID=A0ABD2VSA9_9HYME